MMTSFNRRAVLRSLTASFAGVASAPFLPALAESAKETAKAQRRSCILLWMTGGPSQIDTFDPKPEHDNGGEFAAIETAVPGIRIGEHLPQVAQRMQDLCLLRGTTSKEGDHARGTYYNRTGYKPLGPVQYPTFGSVVSNELTTETDELPGYVSISPYRFLSPGAYGPGFLGPSAAPLVVGGNGQVVVSNPGEWSDNSLRVRNLDAPEGAAVDERLDLLRAMDDDFREDRPALAVEGHRAAYEKAVRLMKSESSQVFDLAGEPDKLRDEYGRNNFGQGCLLARRLVETGVPFVEVSLNGVSGTNSFAWDTHQNNFDAVKSLCGVLDPGWATLMRDLADRGLLETTTVVWMGEFGRTPVINPSTGRDHFPAAFTTVLGGGGIKGGTVHGDTGDDGMKVVDGRANVPDVIATVCKSLGIDPARQNMSNVGRPIRIADPEASPIEEVLS